MIEEVEHTSQAHTLIRLLRDSGRLIRCYTQNFDHLESRQKLCVDITKSASDAQSLIINARDPFESDEQEEVDVNYDCEVVQLHGTLSKLQCPRCSSVCDWVDHVTEAFTSGNPPLCGQCAAQSRRRQERGDRATTAGTLRPAIVLYGEEHVYEDFIHRLIEQDMASSPDLMIVMGTALKVSGVQALVRDFAAVVHQNPRGRVICINRSLLAASMWGEIIDDMICMDCDEWVRDLRRRGVSLWPTSEELGTPDTANPPTDGPSQTERAGALPSPSTGAPADAVRDRKGSRRQLGVGGSLWLASMFPDSQRSR